jgi:prophage antirepressor-like protein
MSAATTALCLDFEGNLVRFVGTKDKLEWIAADVCAVLGLKRARDVLRRLKDNEKGAVFYRTPGGVQQLLTVYESGFYKLVCRSSKPAAERFQDWVFNEVLPCIRKHGTYPAPRSQPTTVVAIGNCPYTKRMKFVDSIKAVMPRNHWCVFLEGYQALARAQELMAAIAVPMGDLDLMDGSMGKTYSNYREGKAWAGPRVRFEYNYPQGDPRGKVFPWAYPMAELQHFRVWTDEVYWPTKFPPYILNKFKDDATEYKKLVPAMQAVKALAPKI